MHWSASYTTITLSTFCIRGALSWNFNYHVSLQYDEPNHLGFLSSNQSTVCCCFRRLLVNLCLAVINGKYLFFHRLKTFFTLCRSVQKCFSVVFKALVGALNWKRLSIAFRDCRHPYASSLFAKIHSGGNKHMQTYGNCNSYFHEAGIS